MQLLSPSSVFNIYLLVYSYLTHFITPSSCDEVLEWNGNCLQNITNDAVYNIINASKNDIKLELIVSRSVNYPGNDDFLNINRITGLQRPISEASFYDSRGFIDPCTAGVSAATAIPIGSSFSPYETAGFGGRIPHSLSLVAAPLYKLSTAAELHHNRAASPLVFHRTHGNYMEAASMAAMQNPVSSAQICGRIEISLLYLIHKRELVVTLHRSYDLVPRQDGSEKSRRQSAALAETLMPVWNESFYYYDLTEPLLMSRVLEVTVWDYDQYEANSFLGETLIDLSQTPLENQPFAYSLLDMDEENPIRLRLRQRRYSSQTPPVRSRSQTSHYNPAAAVSVARQNQGAEGEDYFDCSYSMQNLPYYPTTRPGAPETLIAKTIPSGYFSDHTQAQHYSQIHSRANHRRPRSATALRNVAEMEDSDQSYAGNSNQINSYIPPYELEQLQQRSDGMVEQRRLASNDYNNGKQKGKTRPEVLQEQANTGYGSDEQSHKSS
uniref:C2 domain-containing protein n=1 Tax=Ditylenchus dipsaci TaxID=166011 RepID=A0A915ECB5_9BILA